MNNMNQMIKHMNMNEITNMSNENHGSLYTSQAAESYLRFPATASPCFDWLPCQTEAVCTKTVTLGRCANAYSYCGRYISLCQGCQSVS